MPRKPKEPRPPTAIVRLEAFDMHGHFGGKPFDYQKFFQGLAQLNPKSRRDQVAKKIIAMPTLESDKGLFTFVAYEGQQGAPYLMFNLEDDKEELGRVPTGRVLATRTIGVIDPTRRLAVIQYVFGGVKASQIAILFEKLAETNNFGYRGAEFEFTIRAGESFRAQVAALDVVKFAELRVTRPNADWNDYDELLTDLGAESGASGIDISASAPREEGLSKTKGIVNLIKRLTSGAGTSIVQKAVLKGFRADDLAPSEVKLSRHSEAKTATVAKAPDGAPDTSGVQEQATEFLRAVQTDVNS